MLVGGPARAGVVSASAAPNTIRLQKNLVNRSITVISPVAMQRVGAISSIVGSLLTPSRANCEVVQFQGQSPMQTPWQSNLHAMVLSPRNLENLFNFDSL